MTIKIKQIGKKLLHGGLALLMAGNLYFSQLAKAESFDLQATKESWLIDYLDGFQFKLGNDFIQGEFGSIIDVKNQHLNALISTNNFKENTLKLALLGKRVGIEAKIVDSPESESKNLSLYGMFGGFGINPGYTMTQDGNNQSLSLFRMEKLGKLCTYGNITGTKNEDGNDINATSLLVWSDPSFSISGLDIFPWVCANKDFSGGKYSATSGLSFVKDGVTVEPTITYDGQELTPSLRYQHTFK